MYVWCIQYVLVELTTYLRTRFTPTICVLIGDEGGFTLHWFVAFQWVRVRLRVHKTSQDYFNHFLE